MQTYFPSPFYMCRTMACHKSSHQLFIRSTDVVIHGLKPECVLVILNETTEISLPRFFSKKFSPLKTKMFGAASFAFLLKSKLGSVPLFHLPLLAFGIGSIIPFLCWSLSGVVFLSFHF